jgi:hypothetical protein
VARGYVTVHLEDGETWERVPLGDISHAIVFVGLAENAIRTHGGGGAPEQDNPFAL